MAPAFSSLALGIGGAVLLARAGAADALDLQAAARARARTLARTGAKIVVEFSCGLDQRTSITVPISRVLAGVLN